MGKDKLKRFRENETFDCLVQPAFEEIFHRDHPLKGHWRETFFKASYPICLELGCGRGEYTVALGREDPETAPAGVGVQGAQVGSGAKTATEEKLKNIGFVRTRIEFIDSFFGPDEADEIWITFPDPQLKKSRVKKRLTAPEFLSRYAKFLKPEGWIHLKTDSRHLHEYTKAVIAFNDLETAAACDDIYGTGFADRTLSVKTAYETQYLQRGIPITYLKFRLNGKKDFFAPDFEPDKQL